MTKEKNSDQTQEDIAWLDVESLRAAQAERRLSAGDVTEFFFDRIERLAPTLGAFVSLQTDRARERAKELDARRDRREEGGGGHRRWWSRRRARSGRSAWESGKAPTEGERKRGALPPKLLS